MCRREQDTSTWRSIPIAPSMTFRTCRRHRKPRPRPFFATALPRARHLRSSGQPVVHQNHRLVERLFADLPQDDPHHDGGRRLAVAAQDVAQVARDEDRPDVEVVVAQREGADDREEDDRDPAFRESARASPALTAEGMAERPGTAPAAGTPAVSNRGLPAAASPRQAAGSAWKNRGWAGARFPVSTGLCTKFNFADAAPVRGGIAASGRRWAVFATATDDDRWQHHANGVQVSTKTQSTT